MISRTSVMRYKGGERKPLPIIAEELGVDSILEGTVMRVGDRVRITAQLIDARSDTHLWSERYDRELLDVLALQSDVARAVAQQIQLELTPQESERLTATRQVKPDAHDAYLQGLQHVSVVSPREGAKAIELFEQAIAIDPTFAEAHAAVAYTYQRLGQFLLPAAEAMEKARAAALRALALDDGSALAHATLGQVLWRYDWEWEAGRRELALAVELSPSDAWVLDRYAIYLSAVERHDDAIALARRAVEAAPFDPQMRVDYAIKLYLAGRFQRAHDELLRAIDSDPDLLAGYFVLATVDMELGLAEERRWAQQEFLQRSPRGVPPWVEELLRSPVQSIEEDVRTLLAGRLEHRDELQFGFVMVWHAAYLRENDLAFELLEEMYEKRHAQLVLLKSPAYHPLRSDPRFQDLLRRIGFPES